MMSSNNENDDEQRGIQEKVTIGIGAETVNVIATVFALIDGETLAGFTIGSILALTNTGSIADHSSWIGTTASQWNRRTGP